MRPCGQEGGPTYGLSFLGPILLQGPASQTMLQEVTGQYRRREEARGQEDAMAVESAAHSTCQHAPWGPTVMSSCIAMAAMSAAHSA
jgi:hypothetical protein